MRAPDDPVEFFREELFHSAESAAERIEVLSNVRLIASCLTPRQCRVQLLPVLDELAHPADTPDDEVLHALAPQLLVLTDYFGDEREFHTVIPTLEWLAQQEETIVREAAIEAMGELIETKCSSTYRREFAEEKLLPSFLQLSSSETFPALVSAAHLFPKIYKYLTPEAKSESRTRFLNLARSEMPLVRRAAAHNLTTIVSITEPEDIICNFLDLIHDCWKDPTEAIRVSTVEAVATMAIHLTDSHARKHCFPILNLAAIDASWRIRTALVKMVPLMATNLDPSTVSEYFLPWIEALLVDTELDVQAATVEALTECVDYLPTDGIQNRLLSLWGPLVDSPANVTRSGIAQILGCVAKKVGPEVTISQLLPILERLLDDRVREVRYNATMQLADFCEVLGSQQASDGLFPCIHVAILDKQWRVRSAVVEQTSKMAKMLGNNPRFRLRWESIYFDALLDACYAVRQAAVESVKSLVEELGEEWAATAFLDHLMIVYDCCFAADGRKSDNNSCTSGGETATTIVSSSLSPSSSLEGPFANSMKHSVRALTAYTCRNTLLHAVETIGMLMPQKLVEEKLLPRLRSAASDTLPNVRLTTIRVLGNLVDAGKLDEKIVRDIIDSVLQSVQAEDKDPDVRYFAERTRERCNSWLKKSSTTITT